MVRDYVRLLPDDPQFNAFLTEFQAESERAAAVLAAAYLDDLLSQLLRASFVDNATVVGDLLGDLNALGSFRARADTAYAAGLISRQEHADLTRIRKIRNKFAHRHQDISFDDQSVRDHCAAFEVVRERFDAEPNLQRAYPDTARDKFNLATALLAYYLIRRLHHATRPQGLQPALWPRYDLPGETRA